MQTQRAEKQTFEETSENIVFQFQVFKNQEYVRLNRFSQPKITIGRSPRADLVLDHRSVDEFHADVSLKGGLFFLTNYKPNNGLCVNGRPAKKILLKDRDVIDIGPFSIVFKPIRPAIRPAGSETDESGKDVSRETPRKAAGSPEKKDRPENDWFDDTFAVVLENDYEDISAQEKVAERLGILFKISPDRMLPLLSNPGQIIKKAVSYESAKRLQQILQMAGAGCELKPMEAIRDNLPETKPATTQERRVLDPDEDDEEDPAANFNLKNRLSALAEGAAKTKRANGVAQLEIIKSIGNRVVDVQYIAKGRSCRVDGESLRFRLAGLSGKNRGFVSFPETWQGYLLSDGKKEPLKAYKTNKHLHRRRARLYRLPISPGDTFAAIDGDCEYQVRHTLCSESPAIVYEPKEKEITWRHWGASAGFHLIFLMIACIVFAISSRVPEEENLRFVKIDMSKFEQQPLPEPEVEVTPKKTAPVQKKEPPRIEPAKKTPEVKQKVSKQRPMATVNTSAASAKVSGSKESTAADNHPDAGGGFGEGNIVNRNINQTGLLSLLGDGASAGSSSDAVIAEVTNLDVVEAPGASDKQFSVGGIKGSLGNDKITLASGQAVQTKGSRQVLRSAGAEGPGAVAALERGEIGNRQVKGMVTAKMTRTVSIQGGMSREMVKQVIDRHLEEIQYCYESALLENPAIMGRIVFEWKILMSGKVGEVRIASSTVNSHQIHDCIKAAIKSWQFPKPVDTEVVVSYPFVFDLVGF